MVIIRSNHPNLCCAPYLVLSLGYLNFSQPVGPYSLLQPVNESYQSVMLRTKHSVRFPAEEAKRDSFVHTCESINKLTALALSLLSLLPSVSFFLFCLSVSPSVFPNPCPPRSMFPSLQHTPHWRHHFSPFKSLPNWHSARKGKTSPECTSLAIPRHVHVNAPLHRSTWISLLASSPSTLPFM